MVSKQQFYPFYICQQDDVLMAKTRLLEFDNMVQEQDKAFYYIMGECLTGIDPRKRLVVDCIQHFFILIGLKETKDIPQEMGLEKIQIATEVLAVRTPLLH